jgi:hypothetical protein
MASRNAQTHAKRARELAVRERRELKRAKKAQRAGLTEEPSLDPSLRTARESTDEATDVTVGQPASDEVSAMSPTERSDDNVLN